MYIYSTIQKKIYSGGTRGKNSSVCDRWNAPPEPKCLAAFKSNGLMAWSLGHGQLDTRGETSEVEKGRFYQKNASWTIFCAKWPQKYRYSSIYIAIAAKSFLKEGEKKDLLTFMWDFLLEFMVLEKSHPIKKVDKNPKKIVRYFLRGHKLLGLIA